MNKSVILFSLLVILFGKNASAIVHAKTFLGIKTRVHSVDVELQFYVHFILRVIKSLARTTFEKNGISMGMLPDVVSFNVPGEGNSLALSTI